MQHKHLGKSGLSVSVVGLGCNNFGGRIDLEAARSVVHKALDLGVTLFDTADVYGDNGGSEDALGRILEGRRNDVILASKFGMGTKNGQFHVHGASRYHIMRAVEASLRRLRTDWLDLYQVHRPDPETPIDETLRALDDLVHQGKVRYIGCSNYPAWQMTDALWTSRTLGANAFVSCQDEYSLVMRDAEKELIPAALHHGIGLLPYFPLASGLLTGKYRKNTAPQDGTRFAKMQQLGERYLTPANFALVERLERFAQQHDHTVLELAIAWLAAQPVVSSVIAGATRPEQVEQNVRAATWKLSADDLKAITALVSQP